MRPRTRQYVYSMSSADAGNALDCEPPVLAYLVAQGHLRAQIRMRPYPTWADVRFDPEAVRTVLATPGELARARRAAPTWRTPSMARASALGALLVTLHLV